MYAVTPAGRRLLAYWAGSGLASDRGVHEPGAGFVEHTLQAADLYVRLIEADRAGLLELLGFDAEPASWRTYTTPVGTTGVEGTSARSDGEESSTGNGAWAHADRWRSLMAVNLWGVVNGVQAFTAAESVRTISSP